MRALKILAAIVALATVSIFIISCGGGSSHAQWRFVYASPDLGTNLDVFIDSNSVFTGATYGSASPSSGYTPISSGSHTLNVYPSGQTTGALITSSPSFSSGSNYTVIAENPLSSIQALQLTDDLTAPSTSNFKLRMVHVATNEVKNLDIYVVTPGTDLNTVNANLPNLAYGAASSYLGTLQGGNNWAVIVTPAGSKQQIGSTQFTPAASKIFTFVILDGGTLLQLADN